MTQVNFYNYAGHPNVVNKTLGEPVTLTGEIRRDFEVMNPVITLRTDTRPKYNYCYIPDLNRYYFIDSIIFIGNKDYQVRLRVDVLKTYASEILETTGRVSESSDPDPYTSNRQRVYDMRPNFDKIDFPNTGLLNDTGTVIMVTIKGNV